MTLGFSPLAFKIEFAEMSYAFLLSQNIGTSRAKTMGWVCQWCRGHA
jgi:hypothetical protein